MIHPASFKDPSGFVFQHQGAWYRQVNQSGAEDINTLFESGLYEILTRSGELISHQRITENLTGHPDWYTTLLPEQISRISYSYEWCFDQLKDAALLTLSVCRQAIQKGMILKDATPFNVQFHEGNPVFIDILSFTRYDATQPWVAYRQFGENFLYPLLLAHYKGWKAQELLRSHLDGIPLGLTARLLPWRSRFQPGVALHVFLQNKLARQKNQPGKTGPAFSTQKMDHLLQHLESMIRSLQFRSATVWDDYYDHSILGPAYLKAKEQLFLDFLPRVKGKQLLDLGANDGHFSLLALEKGWEVVAADLDENCIRRLYQTTRDKKIRALLPLCVDLSNPAPALGFAHEERMSFSQRMQTDLVLALALVHHLAIGKNIPFAQQAAYFARLAPELIIEFVPRDDPKTQQLLAAKTEPYASYHVQGFEQAFGQWYQLQHKEQIQGTNRLLYHFTRKER